MHVQGSEFLRHGTVALNICIWQERRAFQKCIRVITHSIWSKEVLVKDYGLPPDMVEIFPNPSALPLQVVPNDFSPKPLEKPVKLLLVGRDYRRKGIDIAIEIVEQLNRSGISAHLTVCGVSGESRQYVDFVGPFKKSEPKQLQMYIALYKQAHILLHPARFDPSPIVTAEAAAFGIPTITNNTGGMATSVKHGVSGIVLPKGSPPESYVQAITDLINDPERYYALCRSTRKRYEEELNWEVAGKKLVAILRSVVAR